MPIITRYILAELSKVFLLTLAAMTLMMLLVVGVKEAMQQGLGLPQIARIVPFLLPDAARYAAPAAVLLAACMVYGRLSANNEVIALKSFGISPMVILWPVIIGSFLLSLVMVWVNDSGVAWGRMGLQRVVIQSVEDIAYGMLRAQHRYSNKQFSINVKRVDGRKLIQPTLTFQATGGSGGVTITADEAELRSDPANYALTVVFRNATVDAGAESSQGFFPEIWEQSIQLADPKRLAELLGPSNLPTHWIMAEIDKDEAQIRALENRQAVESARRLAWGDFAGLTDEAWKNASAQIEDQRSKLFRLRAEPHRRWANGFSCFCFVLIGAPIAMRLRNAGILTTFFLCFGPILVCYYPLLAYGVSRAKVGAMPSYCVWLGNLALAIVGLWLLRKVVRN